MPFRERKGEIWLLAASKYGGTRAACGVSAEELMFCALVPLLHINTSQSHFLRGARCLLKSA